MEEIQSRSRPGPFTGSGCFNSTFSGKPAIRASCCGAQCTSANVRLCRWTSAKRCYGFGLGVRFRNSGKNDWRTVGELGDQRKVPAHRLNRLAERG